VPADTGAGAIFGHQHLLKTIGIHLGKGTHFVAQVEQGRGDVVRLSKMTGVEIISPAKRNDAAITLEASHEFERLQRQAGDKSSELCFFILRDDAFRIAHALRQFWNKLRCAKRMIPSHLY
jgi:hypothetical protein